MVSSSGHRDLGVYDLLTKTSMKLELEKEYSQLECFFPNICNLKYPIWGNAHLEESEFSFDQLSAMERSWQQGFYMLTVLCLALTEIRGTIKVPAVENYPLIRTRSTPPWSPGDNDKSEQLVCLEKQHDQIRVTIPAAHLIWGCNVLPLLARQPCRRSLNLASIYHSELFITPRRYWYADACYFYQKKKKKIEFE